MSPFNADHFSDMDGQPIEDSPEPQPSPVSAAAAPTNWSSSDGGR